MTAEKTSYVVLGGTSGIGAELAKQLESEGTIVYVASRKTGLTSVTNNRRTTTSKP